MHIGSILLANNRQCNLFAAINGVFLHTCHASERTIDAISRMDGSISSSSINNAVKSLSKESEDNIKAKGRTMLTAYVLDNFDVTFKHSTGTTEQSISNMVHLTSGLIMDLAHTSITDLMHSSFLWERSKFNDKGSSTPTDYSMHRLLGLHPEPPPSIESLNRKEDFCRWQFSMDLCTHGPAYFKKFLPYVRPPEAVDQIPLHKTEAVPLRSMKHYNSTVEGNINAIEDSLRQAGVWNVEELMKVQPIPDLEEIVIPFHGDLGTWERIQSAQSYRALEKTSRDRLQFLIFIPGLFHTKMACADALWRMFIAPPGVQKEKASMLAFIDLFYPKLKSKIITNKAGFRVMNDCFTRVGAADRLECLRLLVQERWPECDDLDDFAGLEPTLEDFEYIVHKAAKKFGSSSTAREDYRFEDEKNRDHQYENLLIRIDYILLYEELAYSIRCGDVGRIETCLRRWIPIFRATGKHKYASHLLEFMVDVHFVYPESLRKAVRYNWLCNPTGTPMGFRGVDWLLELENLYTKVIYGGSGSNYTVERIIVESPLIELYRTCKKVVEDQYMLSHKTTRHGDPDLVETYAAMSRLAQSTTMLQFTAGRKLDYLTPDYFSMGMEKLDSEKGNIIIRPSSSVPVDVGEDLTQEDLAVDDDH